MRVLHLTLKKKWFDMIASGEKKEEYRDVKMYWATRLMNGFPATYGIDKVQPDFKDFDYIHFTDGYNRPRHLNIKLDGIKFGYGIREWGAEPGKEYFVIKLGDILK
jgi:hypothetical protein